MYTYSISQWIVFFFAYGFIGWIWECSYATCVTGIKTKVWQWINRGFLHGPLLPIYGFACVAILWVTIPVKEYLWAIYLSGMLVITMMELCTGIVMEKLFGVKYWDYSNYPLNYHGYISLFTSLFWGICAIFIVKVIHTPLEMLFLSCPSWVIEVMAFSLLAVSVYDVSESVREALDMKELLEKLTESRESVRRLENRLDAVVAFSPVVELGEIREKREKWRQGIVTKVEQYRQQRITRLQQLKIHLLDLDLSEEREVLLEQIEQQLQRIRERHNKEYVRAARVLKRNPGMRSKRYQETLDELRQVYRGNKQ